METPAPTETQAAPPSPSPSKDSPTNGVELPPKRPEPDVPAQQEVAAAQDDRPAEPVDTDRPAEPADPDRPASANTGILRHMWQLCNMVRKSQTKLLVQFEALHNAHQSFAEEQRRSIIELKAVVRASNEGGDRRTGHADLPRRPLRTLSELDKLCSDLQRMCAFKKSMVSISTCGINI